MSINAELPDVNIVDKGKKIRKVSQINYIRLESRNVKLNLISNKHLVQTCIFHGW